MIIVNGRSQVSGAVVMSNIIQSTPEYSWFAGFTKPTPSESTALGLEINTATKTLSIFAWNGTEWKTMEGDPE